MDPVRNPFAPGAGTPPPALAGRDELIERMDVSLQRTLIGRPTKSLLLVGLRGVGKTVLLDRMREMALGHRMETLRIEAPEGRSLPSIIAPELRSALLRMSRTEKAKDLAERALRGLNGFLSALSLKYGDIEMTFDLDSEPGLADYGDLEHDFTELLQAAGEAAKAGKTVLALFFDELQYVEENELAALITALHRTTQRRLPIIMVGAGLPQLRGRMGKAKSYSERLFDFAEIGPLDRSAAERAIRIPLKEEDAAIADSALDILLDHTDVELADQLAITMLDSSFFRVRFDRLTPNERIYLRAMAELGPGPHRSGEVAAVLGRPVSSLAPRRAQLIDKGMIWSPEHGDTAFTVPLFDQFMKRVMPKESWRE